MFLFFSLCFCLLSRSRLYPRSQSTTLVQPLLRSARTRVDTILSSDSFSRTEHQIHNSRLMRSSEDHLISVSIRSMQPSSLNTLSSWCFLYNNNFSRGCESNSIIPSPFSTPTPNYHENFSAVGAGFIGASVTLFLALLLVI